MTQSQEVLSRLDALAAKLGVAASHLWAVLVRQAYVEAAGTALFVAMIVALTYVAVRVFRYGRAKEWYSGFDNESACIGTAVACLGLGVCWVIALVQIVCSAQNILNPEYFALSKILEAVK